MQQLEFDTNNTRWQAVMQRDPTADVHFFFAVASTGVYCYPSCAARRPRRENVRYYTSRASAEADGFRACARCRADLAPPEQRRAELVVAACRALQRDDCLSLAELAAAVGAKPQQLQRSFKRITGITPKQFARGVREARVRSALQAGEGNVTDAIFAAGYGSNSRLYERTTEVLGMSPGDFARGATHQHIRFAVVECWLGHMLVAATAAGVCGMFFGDGPRALEQELCARFPQAELCDATGDADFAAWIAAAVAYVQAPSGAFPLPLDLAGTLFQQRVWQALQTIPPGATASYAQVAAGIGQPSATRAVAGACAANPVAVAVPCHRVLRSDGKLSGYRWGVARKRALLTQEAASVD